MEENPANREHCDDIQKDFELRTRDEETKCCANHSMFKTPPFTGFHRDHLPFTKRKKEGTFRCFRVVDFRRRLPARWTSQGRWTSKGMVDFA